MRIVGAFGEGQLARVGVPDEVVFARLARRDDFEAEQLAPRPEVYEVARLVAVDEAYIALFSAAIWFSIVPQTLSVSFEHM